MLKNVDYCRYKTNGFYIILFSCVKFDYLYGIYCETVFWDPYKVLGSLKDGETWQLDQCKSCLCSGGLIRCAMPECPQFGACPPRFKLQREPGQCCPKCVEGKLYQSLTQLIN